MIKQNGFNLIELLIVIAIIGILVSLCYPTYNAHITKVRRTNAEVALLDLAAKLEQYYNENDAYEGATLTNIGAKSVDLYDIAIEEVNVTDYLITATPTGVQAKSDTNCSILGLDQIGNKTISGAGNINDCWN